MRNMYRIVFAALLLSLSFSCKQDIMPPGPQLLVVNPSPVTGSVRGYVTDENNNGVVGAVVKSGTNSTITDGRGMFIFNNIQLDKYASVVSIEKPGFHRALRTFSAKQSGNHVVKIKLITKTLTGSVDASAGGSVVLSDNSQVTLNPNSVVIKATGLPYNGSVKVYAEPIDPTSDDISQIVPGSFQASGPNNTRVVLTSYGMMAVELESASGEPLQISPGKSAKVRFNIPASLMGSSPATIPLWWMNETDGLWKEEGSAVKTGNYYEGNVSHFSFWNVDVPNISVYLEMNIVSAEQSLIGTPLPGLTVQLKRTNGQGSYGITDSLGYVAGFVFINEPLVMEIYNNCNQVIYTQTIGPFSQNIHLGEIQVSFNGSANLIISGSGVNCSSSPVTNGVAMLFYGGQLYYAPLNNGIFTFIIPTCNNASVSAEVYVFDHTASQYSNAWSSSVSTGIVQTGVLSACGNSSVQNINYFIDGSPYSLASTNSSDTIWLVSGNLNPVTVGATVNGVRTGQSDYEISFSYYSNPGGTIPLNVNGLMVNQYGSVTPLSPMTVTITDPGAPGLFMKGNFIGQFRDSSNVIHSISATFQVRR